MTNNLTKWTPQEDQLLREGVRKHGIKWENVKNFMRNIRSVNSIIKRWHGKVKYEKDMKTIRESTGRFPKILPEPPAPPKPRYQEPISEVLDDKSVLWKKSWTERDDKKLKLLVVESGIMRWDLLSQALEADVQELKLRWKKVVYPKMIRQTSKVGGALKWSMEEDKILNVGYKQDISWEDEGRVFLPHRSLGSIEARWRRVGKCFEIKQTPQNRYQARKECLKRIARMKRLAQDKARNQSEMKAQSDSEQQPAQNIENSLLEPRQSQASFDKK